MLEQKPVMYTKNNCKFCNTAKKQFDVRGIEFEERNVEENPDYLQKVMDMGFRTMPVIIPEGGEPFNYDAKKFSEEFGSF